MIGKLRTFGLLTFWGAVVMVAMTPLALLLPWLISGRGYFMLWWTMGLLLLLIAAVFAVRRQTAQLMAIVLDGDPAPGRLRVPHRLRVPSRFEVVLLAQPMVAVMAIAYTLNATHGLGMLAAAVVYAVMWLFLQFVPWMTWARNRDQDPLPPKQGVNGRSSGVHVWNLPAADEDAVHVEVAVRLHEESSFAEVLREVVRAPVLPAIAGGERTWLVLVDGSEVGVLTQRWEHPRWWPGIVWSIDAADRFDGERIRFEPTGR